MQEGWHLQVLSFYESTSNIVVARKGVGTFKAV